MIWWIFFGLLGWGLVFYQLDRPSVPACKVRDAYRITSLLLFLLMLGIVAKAMAWHEELVLTLKALTACH